MTSVLAGSRVLVTGGGGFIGSNLLQHLLSRGCRLRATLHRRPAVLEHDDIEYVTADLTVMDDCRRVVDDVDFVFMCAANTSGAGVISTTPLVHVTPNVVMNAQMLEAAYFAKVRKFLFISSNAAYPPTGDRPVREDEMFEGDPCEAYYFAGWMKRYSEILCKTYATKLKTPMATTVVRPSNVYGPYDKFDFSRSHVTAALVRRVVERQTPLVVWGTGNDVRDLIYIGDFVEGVLRAVACPDQFLAINIASGKTYSVGHILDTILRVDGWADADVQFDSSKPTTIAARMMDVTLARQHLGFSASTSLDEGLARTIAWYRANRETWTK